MVRPHRSIAAAALAVVLALSSSAGAQDKWWRATVAAGLQFTDNLDFAAMNGADGTAKPKPGFTGEVNPALVFSYETPRSLNEMQYAFAFASVLGNGDQINYANRLELRTRYDLSEVTVANFAIRAAQAQQTFFPNPQPGKAVDVVVPGFVHSFAVEIAQGVARQLSPDAALTEQIGLNAFYPIASEPPRPPVYGANLALAFQYNDDPENYGVNFGSQLAVVGDVECTDGTQCAGGRVCAVATKRCVIPEDIAEPNREIIENTTNAPQLANRLAGNVRHDFKNGFTGELELGVQQVMRLTDGGGQNWGPAGRFALRYDREEAALAFTFNQGTQLNVDLGGLVLASAVELVGTVPIDRQTRNWMLQLQTGYQHGTTLAELDLANPYAEFDLFAADAALAYRPERWLPNFAIALRYQFRYQISSAQPGASAAAVDLHAMRNAVALTVAFEFPERNPKP